MVAGDALIGALEDGLDASQAGVLVWSSAAADSDWVKREYRVMESRTDTGFHFVPLRLDSAKLPTFAAQRLFLDFAAYPDGPNGGELLRLLHGVVGQPLSGEAAHFAAEQDLAAKQTFAQIKAEVGNGDEQALLRLFEVGGSAWEVSAALGCVTADGLTRLGKNDLAMQVLDRVIERFPLAIRPKQLRALALARSGNVAQAQSILGALYEDKHRDPETLGIYARTWMDRYQETKNGLFLRKSRDLYAEAFEGAQDDYYTGINAAAKSVFLGTEVEVAKGRLLAQRVEALVGTRSVSGDYWKTATVAEVQLILGHYAEAAARYTDAVSGAPTEVASHESTWKQAARLMAAMNSSADERALVRGAFAHLPDVAS